MREVRGKNDGLQAYSVGSGFERAQTIPIVACRYDDSLLFGSNELGIHYGMRDASVVVSEGLNLGPLKKAAQLSYRGNGIDILGAVAIDHVA